MSVQPATRLPARTLRLLQAAVLLFLAFKLYIAFAMPPIGDEAYYWLWGQRPALSYFDHPPLHAWLLGLVSLLFGWSLFSLRLLTWLTLGGTLWIVWLWSKRLAPDRPGDWFWPAAALYLASPLFLAMTSITFHDHLLILLCLASAHFFLAFAESAETGPARLGPLYIAAILLGLAVLTKYNAVLFGIGVAVFFFARPALRQTLRSPHPYLAALLAVAMQAPVFWWNLTEGLASYRFHMVERWDGPPGLRPEGLLLYLLFTVAVVSPFLIGPIARFLTSRPAPGFAARARSLALAVFTVSTAAMLVLSLFVEVFFYWNIVAFLLLPPLLVGAVGRGWQLWGHLLYGLVFAVILACNMTALPVAMLFAHKDWTIASMHGWDEVAGEIAALRAEHPDTFLATTRYTTAAQLAWALRSTDVTAIAERTDQFDYWFDAEAHTGRNALIVDDAQETIAWARTKFARVTEKRALHILRFGQEIFAPRIWFAENYRP